MAHLVPNFYEKLKSRVNQQYLTIPKEDLEAIYQKVNFGSLIILLSTGKVKEKEEKDHS